MTKYKEQIKAAWVSGDRALAFTLYLMNSCPDTFGIAKLAQIQEELAALQARADDHAGDLDPSHWAHVGDLDNILASLQLANRYISQVPKMEAQLNALHSIDEFKSLLPNLVRRVNSGQVTITRLPWRGDSSQPDDQPVSLHRIAIAFSAAKSLAA